MQTHIIVSLHSQIFLLKYVGTYNVVCLLLFFFLQEPKPGEKAPLWPHLYSYDYYSFMAFDDHTF